MPRFSITFFNEGSNRGLWINGPREATPKGFWRRNTGSHGIRERLLRSRDGSVADVSVANAHSLTRFNDIRFQGASTQLFRAGISISTGLDGTPLDFEVSEPRTGTDAEFLFHCGGGRLEKVDTAGAVSQWGIAAPTGGNWGTSPGGTGEDDTETTITPPQQKTIGDTTTLTPAGTTGWTGSVQPFIVTDGVLSGSGSAVCIVAQDDDEEPVELDP